ncbi:uncharacterized protein LOC115880369 [Sitophilus oryzae]|uniref:Uncharacterized protein LOC115880369 n=1 Tax=Sitophilus oryzae TaxID=7048 RepID=A0A6J2XPY3_SITOR|nr:uncharacterized protein LOC115880369 [Sitophilus oryzae]
MSVEEAQRKLAEYRAKKQREAALNRYKAQIKIMFSKFFPKKPEKTSDTNCDTNTDKKEVLEPLIVEDINSECESASALSDEEENLSCTIYDYIYYFLWFVLWVSLYIVFVRLQFGTVYFIVSLLLAIYFNTRTGPKKVNEVSAYSVFNRNCESIDGTLNAEQLTREMIYGGFR